MGNKISSQGTKLMADIGSVMTEVASVVSLDFPDGEVLFFDGTALDSDYVEDGELTGLATPGVSNAELFYDPADAGHKALAADHAAKGVHREFEIVMPDEDESEVTFEGSVQRFQPKAATKEGLKANLSIKLRSLAIYP